MSLNQLKMKFLDNFFSAANLTIANPSSKFHVWRERVVNALACMVRAQQIGRARLTYQRPRNVRLLLTRGRPRFLFAP